MPDDLTELDALIARLDLSLKLAHENDFTNLVPENAKGWRDCPPPCRTRRQIRTLAEKQRARR
jgi:hypothetical protein